MKFTASGNKVKRSLLWGTTTWLLFHWVAANIDAGFFAKNCPLILNHIVGICCNLPCPDCSQHAKDFLKVNSPFKLVRTKEHLQNFLFGFHNVVNKRAKNVEYKREDLKLYEKRSGVQLLKNWSMFFKIEQGIVMNDFMAKQRLQEAKTAFYKFLVSNRKHFTNF
jgi:hypothetical protein